MGLRQGETRKDALQCIFLHLHYKSLVSEKKSFFGQWNSWLIKILLQKMYLDIFLCEIVFLKHQQECFANIAIKYCKKIQKLIVTCQWEQHSVDTWYRHKKLLNVINQHTIFKKSAINPKWCKILTKFCLQIQLRLSSHNL